jgi:hypothetical protein
VFKDIQILKPKRVYVCLFFEFLEHMDPFLWNILKFTKKLKQFGEHLIREKDFLYKKTACHMIFLNVLNI